MAAHHADPMSRPPYGVCGIYMDVAATRAYPAGTMPQDIGWRHTARTPQPRSRREHLGWGAVTPRASLRGSAGIQPAVPPAAMRRQDYSGAQAGSPVRWSATAHGSPTRGRPPTPPRDPSPHHSPTRHRRSPTHPASGRRSSPRRRSRRHHSPPAAAGGKSAHLPAHATVAAGRPKGAAPLTIGWGTYSARSPTSRRPSGTTLARTATTRSPAQGSSDPSPVRAPNAVQ